MLRLVRWRTVYHDELPARVLEHVFTLAHEAGHSMHSYYSAKHQPFQYYNYTIFVAESGEYLNEQTIDTPSVEQSHDQEQRAMLINREIDSIRSPIFRQTMFAEFEKMPTPRPKLARL